MKLMHSEWQDRVKHWVRTLRDDFYEPLGEIRWEAFRTMDHLSPEEALQGHFTSVEPGFIWGKTWEYCWFKGTVIRHGWMNHISLLKITVWQSAEKKETPMRF